MGRIQCPIHGIQPFLESCTHLFSEEERWVSPGYQSLPILNIRLCKTCSNPPKPLPVDPSISIEELFALPEATQLKVEQALTLWYGMIDRKITCLECWHTQHLTITRRSGAPDPFVAYENTLMHEDQKTIESLKIHLTQHLAQGQEGFAIIPGGITFPLCILIFKVIEEREQAAVEQIIANFFQHQPKKQRQIQFVERKYGLLNGFNAAGFSSPVSKNVLHEIYRDQ